MKVEIRNHMRGEIEIETSDAAKPPERWNDPGSGGGYITFESFEQLVESRDFLIEAVRSFQRIADKLSPKEGPE